MSLKTSSLEGVTNLPPLIISNSRKRIEPEKVDAKDIALKNKTKFCSILLRNPKLVPRYPLSLMWAPNQMYFEINSDVIESNLRIWNNNYHPIYVQYCGLWDDTAKLGASWYCYPRTRIMIPTGLSKELTIKATPRLELESQVPVAYISLQLAAAHMRDNVTGYFVVPIVVTFSKYIELSFGEGG